MLLRIKDIREVLEKTLSMFYAFPDFSLGSTKVMDKDKEFRIEFRIYDYDTEFWMDIDPSIDSVHIATRALRAPAIDSIQMWFSKPFEYDKSRFEFGWRTDLEEFFDAFHTALLEKLAKTQKANMAAVYGLSTKVDEPKSVVAQCIDAVYGNSTETKSKELKPSIFNSLKDGEDEYI